MRDLDATPGVGVLPFDGLRSLVVLADVAHELSLEGEVKVDVLVEGQEVSYTWPYVWRGCRG